jgi:hypothetical protein
MGCDIHSMVEVREKRYQGSWVGEDGKIAGLWRPGSERWVALDSEDGQLFPNTYYNPESNYEPFTRKGRMAPFDDRNYDLFALLAGVRSDGRHLEPLSEPRGVPSDASYTWLAEVDGWSVDMHSHSWFTLAELVAFRDAGRLSTTVTRTGVLSLEDYEKLRDHGVNPTGWSGSISGRGIRTVNSEDWDAGARPVGPPITDALYLPHWRKGKDWDEAAYLAAFEEPRYYIKHTWDDTLGVGGEGSELMNAIVELERFAVGLPPKWMVDAGEAEDKPVDYLDAAKNPIPHENIRVVFGFDN